MRTLAKAIGIVVAVLAVLAAAALGATKAIHSRWNHERAAASITRWASDGLRGDGPTHQGFTFGRVDYPWLPAVASILGGRPVHFDAWDITIWDPDGDEVLHAAHVEAGIRLDRLVWAKARGYLPFQPHDLELHFVDAIIVGLRCHIHAIHDGKVNLVAAFTSRDPPPPVTRDGMVISVDGSAIDDGELRVAFGSWSGEAHHIDTHIDRLRYSSFHDEQGPDKPAFTYHASSITASSGRMVIGDYGFPLDHIRASELAAEEPHRENLQMNVVAGSLGADLAVHGRLTDTYSDTAGVDLRLSVRHAARMLERLPTSKALTGDPNASAHISGRFGDIVIEGAADGAEVKYVGIDARNIRARFRIEHATLRFHDITSDVREGHVSGDFTLKLHARAWSADLELENPRSVLAGRFLPVEILAYLLAPIRLVQSHHEDTVGHLSVSNVDATLYRRPMEALPHRVLLAGKL